MPSGLVRQRIGRHWRPLMENFCRCSGWVTSLAPVRENRPGTSLDGNGRTDSFCRQFVSECPRSPWATSRQLDEPNQIPGELLDSRAGKGRHLLSAAQFQTLLANSARRKSGLPDFVLPNGGLAAATTKTSPSASHPKSVKLSNRVSLTSEPPKPRCLTSKRSHSIPWNM